MCGKLRVCLVFNLSQLVGGPSAIKKKKKNLWQKWTAILLFYSQDVWSVWFSEPNAVFLPTQNRRNPSAPVGLLFNFALQVTGK